MTIGIILKPCFDKRSLREFFLIRKRSQILFYEGANGRVVVITNENESIITSCRCLLLDDRQNPVVADFLQILLC
jgi:hypothetical protein